MGEVYSCLARIIRLKIRVLLRVLVKEREDPTSFCRAELPPFAPPSSRFPTLLFELRGAGWKGHGKATE